MECLYFHSQVPEGATFCQNCGAKIEVVQKPIEYDEQTEFLRKQVSSAQHDNTDEQEVRKTKKSNCSTLIIIIVIALFFIGYKMLNKDDGIEDNNTNNETTIKVNNNKNNEATINVNIDNSDYDD